MSAEALPSVLALCPRGVRVAAWHRGERPAPGRWPLHAWEPVIYFGGPQLSRSAGDPRRVDSIVCGVADHPPRARPRHEIGRGVPLDLRPPRRRPRGHPRRPVPFPRQRRSHPGLSGIYRQRRSVASRPGVTPQLDQPSGPGSRADEVRPGDAGPSCPAIALLACTRQVWRAAEMSCPDIGCSAKPAIAGRCKVGLDAWSGSRPALDCNFGDAGACVGWRHRAGRPAVVKVRCGAGCPDGRLDAVHLR
jgi:hypothetical protein